MLSYNVFLSPVGRITIAANITSLRELHLEDDRYFSTIPHDWVYDPRHKILLQAHKELVEYFEGHRSRYSVPVTFTGTAFQIAVWNQLKNIPLGKSLTYREIAALIDKPKAVRAVGTAVGRNPICIIIPCHRVLASDGSLGGYVAGLERKQYLLAQEDALHT